MSKRQASILAAFSRQQEAQAKRKRVADAAGDEDAATVRKRRVGERWGPSEALEDDETGSVTDGDLFSSQEDAQDSGGDGGGDGNGGGRRADAASAVSVDSTLTSIDDDGERDGLPVVVEDVVDKVGEMELSAVWKLSPSIASTRLHLQKEVLCRVRIDGFRWD